MQHIYLGVDYESMKKKLLSLNAIEVQNIDEYFCLINKIHETVKSKNQISQDDLSFYFSTLGDDIHSLAFTILSIYHYSPESKFEEQLLQIKRMYKLNGDEVQRCLISKGDYFEDDLNNFMSDLHDSEYTDSEKWKIASVISDFEFHLERIFTLLCPVSKIIDEYKDEILPFLIYFEKRIQNQKSITTMLQNFGFSLEDTQNSNDLFFKPLLFLPGYYGFFQRNYLNDTKIVLLGLLFNTQFTTTGLNLSVEYIPNVFGALSDELRINILLLLKSKSCYGQEIANHFNVPKAKISYHMSLLLEAQLVKIRKSNNKIYYDINTEEFEKIIDTIRNVFL